MQQEAPHPPPVHTHTHTGEAGGPERKGTGEKERDQLDFRAESLNLEVAWVGEVLNRKNLGRAKIIAN